MNITVIEDHDALRMITLEALRQQGHQARGLSCAEALNDEAGGAVTDLFIIDVNLPGENGLSLARRLRSTNPLVGIIVTTGRTKINDRIASYDSGADVYLPKPVAFEELHAAIASVRRRVDFWHAQTRKENGGQFLLDSRTLILSGAKGRTSISAKDLLILKSFTGSPEGKLEHWQLMELLGQSLDKAGKANLEVRIVRLRKKLQLVGAEPNCLSSMRGIGYQLCVPLQIV